MLFGCSSKSGDEVAPEQVGLSLGRLQHLTGLLQKHVDTKKIAGSVTLIARHGKIALFKTQGLADNAKPIQKYSIFRIVSMTKPITSVAIMLLYEQGKLLPSDQVSKYIPEFRKPKVVEMLPDSPAHAYKLVAAKREVVVDFYRQTEIGNGSGKYLSGGAGVLSTAYDYFRFLQMLLNKGELDGVRLLSRKTVELMTATNHIGAMDATLLHSHGWKFGLGFAIQEDRRNKVDSGDVGVFEWAGYYSTRFSVNPREQMITIFLSQTSPFGAHFGLWDKIMALSNSAIVD